MAVARLDEDLVFHARSVGQPRHFLVIRAGHASGCNLAQRRSATIGNQPPLALHQLADARSNSFHQFVEVDVLLRGLDHSLPHFGQDQRTADDGIGPLAVDQGTHAEAFVGWICQLIAH